MTQEELLFIDLCARLPYRVICHSNKFNLDGELLFINKVYNIVALYNEKAIGKFDTCLIADIKPYLRPMSSVSKMWGWLTEEEIKNPWVLFDLPVDALDYFLTNHIDYRGLIEKGLALEAKEGMYKTE